VPLDDLSRCDVDLDQFVNIGGIERAVIEREPGRRVQALDPFAGADGSIRLQRS
jgi:hypothetical protein